MLIAARMNRSAGGAPAPTEWLFLYVASMILVALLVIVLEYTHRVFLHTAICYRVIGMLTPIVLVIASRVTGRRWAATTVTAMYSVFLLGLLWILPLFPAQPKLGPVLHEVTQFIPSGFPLLVIAPAFVLDLLWPRMVAWKMWQQAVISGALFLAVLLPVQWPFADFLQSPGARNAVFGSIYYDYNQSPQGYAATWRFVPREHGAQFREGLTIALACSIASMWLGMGAGEWLKRARR